MQNKNYHLTEEQINFFDENGYLILKNHIPAELLKNLQKAGENWINQGLEKKASGQDMTAGENVDFRFAKKEDGSKRFFRVDYLHNKQEAASLEVLGSPQVLGVAECLCGPNFVPSYESMVFKFEGDGEAIPWHQDAVLNRNHRVFNFDIYLDASKNGAGALHVLPGSHLSKKDICQIENNYGWDFPDGITVEMEPGDVLLHDVMVVHGSPEVSGNALRRTVYLEFRSIEQIKEEGPWDMDFVKKRLQLIPIAQKHFAKKYPEQAGFQWNVNPEYLNTNYSEGEILRALHLKHSPNTFCSATSE